MMEFSKVGESCLACISSCWAWEGRQRLACRAAPIATGRDDQKHHTTFQYISKFVCNDASLQCRCWPSSLSGRSPQASECLEYENLIDKASRLQTKLLKAMHIMNLLPWFDPKIWISCLKIVVLITYPGRETIRNCRWFNTLRANEKKWKNIILVSQVSNKILSFSILGFHVKFHQETAVLNQISISWRSLAMRDAHSWRCCHSRAAPGISGSFLWQETVLHLFTVRAHSPDFLSNLPWSSSTQDRQALVRTNDRWPLLANDV